MNNNYKEKLARDFIKNLVLYKEEYFDYIQEIEIILEECNPLDFATQYSINQGVKVKIRDKYYQYTTRTSFRVIHLLIESGIHNNQLDFFIDMNNKITEKMSVLINDAIADLFKEDFANKLDEELEDNKKETKKVKI